MFFGVMTPIGLLMRVLGKRPIRFVRQRGLELLGRPDDAARPDDKAILRSRIPCRSCAELWRLPACAQEILADADRLMMVIFGGLLVLAKGSAVAPFIYTLF